MVKCSPADSAVTAVARSPTEVTDRLPVSAPPLSTSGWRSQRFATHSRSRSRPRSRSKSLSGKPEMGPPCPSSVVSLPALSPSSRSNDRSIWGRLAIQSFCASSPVHLSSFNSFLLARFPSSACKSGILPCLVFARLFLHFLAGIPMTERSRSESTRGMLYARSSIPLHGLNIRISDM
jgi:hypothetical protein